VNLLDLIIVALAFGAAVGGYRLGLLARATSWGGMLIGLFLTARIVEPVAEAMEGASPLRILLTAAGLLIGGAFLGQAVGLLLGARLNRTLREGPAREVDKVGGAIAGALGVAIVVWLVAPAMARVPGTSARLARQSVITGALAEALPPPPDALRTLERIVGTELPAVLDAFEQAPDLGPPPAESGLDAEVAEAAAASTVKVEAYACGRVQDGSGSVLMDPDYVVTNAHVVAGADEVFVERYPDGEAITATVVGFDPARDLAVLRADGLDRPALPLVSAEEGDVGAVFGHPGGGPLELSPFQVGREVTATGRDIYDAAPTSRQVLFLAAQLQPGDSGGALVDPAGEVVGVAFAIAPDDPNVAYALTVAEVEAVLSGPLEPVSPGPCL
jgi:S1-C subfamily serine protease